MAEAIQLEILTPEKVVLNESVESVTAPGTLGEFGVLPGHAPLVSTLGTGEVRIKKDNQDQFLAISGGFAEVGNNKVTILAETAEPLNEIDIKRAEAAKTRAEEKRKTLTAGDVLLIETEEALARAQNRIRAASRKT